MFSEYSDMDNMFPAGKLAGNLMEVLMAIIRSYKISGMSDYFLRPVTKHLFCASVP